MKLKDVNLNNIKLVIFDFDETLATEESFINWYYNAYTNPEYFYDEIEPCVKSEVLYNLVSDLRSRNIKMYCLSGMKFSFHLKAKQAFVNKYYGNDIEVISTSLQELKLKGVKILQKINNCNLNEILFIDDKSDVVEFLNQNGIKAINVEDIEL